MNSVRAPHARGSFQWAARAQGPARCVQSTHPIHERLPRVKGKTPLAGAVGAVSFVVSDLRTSTLLPRQRRTAPERRKPSSRVRRAVSVSSSLLSRPCTGSGLSYAHLFICPTACLPSGRGGPTAATRSRPVRAAHLQGGLAAGQAWTIGCEGWPVPGREGFRRADRCPGRAGGCSAYPTFRLHTI